MILLISALSKFQKENFEEILIKIGKNPGLKILFKKSHAKNRPRRAVFQICICTDSQFVDLKTEKRGFEPEVKISSILSSYVKYYSVA